MSLELPTCGVGKKVTRKDINGNDFSYEVEDFVGFVTPKKNKFICLQRIRHIEPILRLEYRFAYYMIGVKPGAEGRWVFGQYALMIGADQLKNLLKMANKKWPDFSKLLPE